MRFRQNFTLHKRGKYWYYRCYDDDGKLITTSTGITNKNEAYAFVQDLFKYNLLLPANKEKCGKYFKDFFDDNSPYMKDKMRHGTKDRPALSKSTITRYRGHNKIIYSYFKDIMLGDINVKTLRMFRESLLEEEYTNKTVNNIVSVLSVMLTFLIYEDVIKENATRKLIPLTNDSKKVPAYTMEQAKYIFSYKWEDYELQLVHLVMACTGMRISEVLAIRKNTIHDDYIEVKDQRPHSDGKLYPLKTKEKRVIPICKKLHDIMIFNLHKNGYLFNLNHVQVYHHTDNEFQKNKMNEAWNNGLCLHSWRHFFNTYLLAENITEVKVNFVIGHSNKVQMQDVYTNFTADMLKEVAQAQEKLFINIFHFEH